MEKRMLGKLIIGIALLLVLILAFGKPLQRLGEDAIRGVKQLLGMSTGEGRESGIYGDISHSTIPAGAKKEYIKTLSTKPGIPVNEKYFGTLPSDTRRTSISTVVLHHTGDISALTTINTLKNRGLSVHYVIDKDGTIYYLVDESREAWHVGCCSPSTPRCCEGGTNCPICLEENPEATNDNAIGIEIVNTGNVKDKYTDEQYEALNALLEDIDKRHPGISVDNSHVFGHYQITVGKWDPSPNFDWNEIGLGGHILLASLGLSPPADAGYITG